MHNGKNQKHSSEIEIHPIYILYIKKTHLKYYTHNNNKRKEKKPAIISASMPKSLETNPRNDR
jgi:hypothetical protein